MTIDTSGKWWKGSEPDDLREYPLAFGEANSLPIDEFHLCRCPCGSQIFGLHVEQDEGVARRTCIQCQSKHWIVDSAENYEKGLRLKKFKCVTCKSNNTNVAVGFSFTADNEAIKWVFVGNRCADCGVLGSMVVWKIGYMPSLQLLGKA